MILQIDLKILNTKEKLISYLSSHIEGLYGTNYDALIDAMTYIHTPMTLELLHKNEYEDCEELEAIFKIIQKENPLIIIKKQNLI